MTKVCNICNVEKSLNEFSVNNRNKDGYKNTCKECINKGATEKQQNTDENIKKICTKCKRELPATKTYFYKDGKGKYGCHSQCKECQGGKFGYLIPATEEENKQKRRLYYQKNKEKIKEYIKNNKEKYNEQAKKYYKKNRNKVLEREKKRYEENGDILKQRVNNYRKTVQGKTIAKNAKHKRRSRKKNGVGISVKQWNKCLEYFDGRCAYSGELAENYHMDHIVPLSTGGEHSYYNIVPCMPKYNIQKSNKNMEEWYREQPYFSEERLNKIYEYMSLKEIS